MSNLVYFAFYRNNDDHYPLSKGYYDLEHIKQIKTGNTYWFHHPDEDKLQRYRVDRIETAFYKGRFLVCASTNFRENAAIHMLREEYDLEMETIEQTERMEIKSLWKCL